jgi:hypothetical protein
MNRRDGSGNNHPTTAIRNAYTFEAEGLWLWTTYRLIPPHTGFSCQIQKLSLHILTAMSYDWHACHDDEIHISHHKLSIQAKGFPQQALGLVAIHRTPKASLAGDNTHSQCCFGARPGPNHHQTPDIPVILIEGFSE